MRVGIRLKTLELTGAIVPHAVDVLYLLTLYLSKCCTIAIYHRLTPCERHRDILWGLLGLGTLWIITSTVMIAVSWGDNDSWATSGEPCHNLVHSLEK